ncbi:DUF488 domain-containing protein [Cupriavidus oxalaticus]|uniref:DUF488 domain-containing protein n=1 Tax=Cupriavidus oxalaticus TaxID=96344 RepID=UPI003F734C81
MTLPFYTIGHSNQTLAEFFRLLRDANIGALADIRKIPKSRSNPQFNEDPLREALSAFDISYEHVAGLGGLRGRTQSVPRDVNGFWTNESFHNYADYALSGDFRAGLDQLIDLGRKRRCVIMCAEAVWWRCHRRIVADYLIAGGETVFHILGHGRLEPARLSVGAIVQSGGSIHYPG